MTPLPRKRAFFTSIAAIFASLAPAAAQQVADLSAPAQKAETSSEDNGDIIITARRTNERALDVPIAVSVIGGRDLEQKGTYTLEDVQRQVPSFTAFNSNPRNSSVGIRGIGVSSASDGLDTSVGFYFDNVYLGRPGMALSDLIDIERFEVLRGPQGTLFGRNTSAGVVQVITRKPSFTPSAQIEGSLGDYAYNQARFSLTGPLIDDKLAYRLTGFNTHRNGVLKNTKTGIDANSIGRSGARLQLLATPSTNFSVRVIGDYSIEDDTCCVSVLASLLPTGATVNTTKTFNAFSTLGYVPQANFNATQNNASQNMRTDQHGVSAEAKWDIGWADLTSISAYRYWHFDPLQDSDGTPLDIIQVNVAQTKDDQFTQELRLVSKPGRFNWQTGAYAFHQSLTDHFILNQFGTDASAFYTAYAGAPVTIAPGSQYLGDTYSKSQAYAVFGQANYDLTDKLTLTAGARYTTDKRTGISDTSTVGTPYAPTSLPFHYNTAVKGENVSYLGTLAYKPTENSLLYLSYSTGYKAAGLNLNAAVTAGTPLIVQPEKVKDWEIGYKQSLINGSLTFNVDAFTLDLTGLQSNIAPAGVRSYLANVGDVRSQGFEGDLSWRISDNFDWSVSGAYVDAKYKTFKNAPCPVISATTVCDLTGKPLFQSPKYTSSTTLRGHGDISEHAELYGLVQYSYRSESYGDVQLNPQAKIEAYGLVNARVGTKIDDKYDLSVWVDNATDETYFQSLGSASIVGAGAYGFSGRLGTPRTIGATLRATF